MNWLNCNKCGVTKTAGSEIQLFCESCSHVLCSKCNNLKVCPIDKRPFNGIKITSSMPEKLRPYFSDPRKLLTTWQKCIRFQFDQRTHCEASEYTRNLKQLRQYKEEIKLLIKTKAILKESFEKVAKRNNKMKLYRRYCLQQKQSYFDNSSQISGTSTEATNFSSMLGESGVDMQFDELNSSR